MSVIQKIDVRSLLLLDLQLNYVNNWSASAAINNASDTTYATAGAVKKAYDLANAAIPQAGGTASGLVRFTQGVSLIGNDVNTLKTTSFDGASYDGANVVLTSWYGIGFSSPVGGSVPSGKNAFWFDVRNGNMTAFGDVNARLFRSNYGDQASISGAMAFRINNGDDNYIRFCSDISAIRTYLHAAQQEQSKIIIPPRGGTTGGFIKSEVATGGATSWMTDKPDTDATHKGIGIDSVQGPVYWSGSALRYIYTQDRPPTPAEVGAVALDGVARVSSIQANGTSLPWGSINLSGSKGGYAGIYFTDVAHWFGVTSEGVSGVWRNDGGSKWFFDKNGVLGGGATVPWAIVTGRPDRTNWVESGVKDVVSGMLAWRNYGNGHVIFDASSGLSPAGTAINKTTPETEWIPNYPTLMGWNGANTFAVRVDSARRADSAAYADSSGNAVNLNGGAIRTVGHDFMINNKRALVGFGASEGNLLVINYARDFGSVHVDSPFYAQYLESNRHVAIQNGAANYGTGQLEARSTDGSDVIIGLHRSGYTAAAIRHNNWGIFFEREAGAASRANVAAANFFADAAQDMTANALTRKDYVDSVTKGYGLGGNAPVSRQNWDNVNAPIGWYEYNYDAGDRGGATGYGVIHTIPTLNAQNYDGWAHQMFYDRDNNIYHRTGRASATPFAGVSWKMLYDTDNLKPIEKNKGNILNNSSFGVGFLSSSNSGAPWISAYFGDAAGNSQVVIGNLGGKATVGAHNADKSAWADLMIGCQTGGAANNPTYISLPYAKVLGFNGAYEIFHRGNLDPDAENRFVSRGDAANCNDAVANGHWRLTPSSLNSPNAATIGHMFTVSEGWGIGNTGAWLQQTAYMHDGTIWTRRSVNGTWFGWTRLWDSVGFDPNSKLSNNGAGGTLTLNNWFRSTGKTGWYNESYGGGIYMEDTMWVRVFGDKLFHVANSSYNAINTTGGVKSFYTIGVEADRWATENGDSYTDNRYSDAPLNAVYSSPVAAGSFQPIISGRVFTAGYGYFTRVKLGMLTGAGTWAKANLFVGSAESNDHPMANYTFDAYGNVAGVASITGNSASATKLQTARAINGVGFDGQSNITVEPYIEFDESSLSQRYITFVDNHSEGYQRLNIDAGITYSPLFNTLSCDISGMAAKAKAAMRFIPETNVLTTTSVGSVTASVPTSLFGVTPAYVLYQGRVWGSGGTDLRQFHVSAETGADELKFVMGTSSDDTDQGGSASVAGHFMFVLPYNASQPFFIVRDGVGVTVRISVVGYQIDV